MEERVRERESKEERLRVSERERKSEGGILPPFLFLYLHDASVCFSSACFSGEGMKEREEGDDDEEEADERIWLVAGIDRMREIEEERRERT